MLVIAKYLNDIRRSPRGLRVAVQGFGNVGSNAAVLLEEQGCDVFAVPDMYGAISGRNGKALPMRKVAEHVVKTGSVIEFPGSEPLTNEDLLLLDCDILIPAASVVRLCMARTLRKCGRDLLPKPRTCQRRQRPMTSLRAWV